MAAHNGQLTAPVYSIWQQPLIRSTASYFYTARRASVWIKRLSPWVASILSVWQVFSRSARRTVLRRLLFTMLGPRGSVTLFCARASVVVVMMRTDTCQTRALQIGFSLKLNMIREPWNTACRCLWQCFPRPQLGAHCFWNQHDRVLGIVISSDLLWNIPVTSMLPTYITFINAWLSLAAYRSAATVVHAFT